jgi:hypothetical protein
MKASTQELEKPRLKTAGRSSTGIYIGDRGGSIQLSGGGSIHPANKCPELHSSFVTRAEVKKIQKELGGIT